MADRAQGPPPSKPLPAKPTPPALPPKPAFIQPPAKAPPPLPPKPQHVAKTSQAEPKADVLAMDGAKTFLPGMCGTAYGYGLGGGGDKKGGEEWMFEGMPQYGMRKVVAGETHGAMIVVGKKQGLYTWTISSPDKPATPTLETVYFSETGIADVACSKDTTAVVTEDGDAFVWALSHRFIPRPPTKLVCTVNAKKVACGDDHVLVLSDEGKVLSWGSNQYAQLGLGKDVPSADIPLEIPQLANHRVTSISAGLRHSAAVTKEQRLFMWGSNAMGQCGVGEDRREIFVPEVPLGRIALVACGYFHTIATSVDGGLFACGNNAEGQCGKSSTASAKKSVSQWEEIQAGQHQYLLLAAGASHSLAYTASKMLFAWGSGARGQLGAALSRAGGCNFPKPMAQPAVLTRGAEMLAISAGGYCSLLLVKEPQLSIDYGMDLNSYLYKDPHEPIPVAAATWNVNNSAPTQESLRWFRRVSRTGALVVFGLQEVDLRGRTLAVDTAHKMDRNVKSAFKGFKDGLKDGSFGAAAQGVKSGWAEGSQKRSGAPVMIQSKLGEQWRQAVRECLGADYTELVARQMVGVMLLVFVHRSQQAHVTPLFCNSIGCGLMGGGGNKGGVAASFQVHGSRLCCVSAHLTAHDKKVDERNSDFHEILQGILTEGCTGGHVLSHDSVLWLGDLNYRVNLPRATAESHARGKQYSTLLQHDQLRQQIAEGKAFRGFEEAPIGFGPTFKFDVGTNDFDSSPKQRVPAYTDRILVRNHRQEYNAGRGLEVVQYDRADSTESDHRPVFCTLRYRPGSVSDQRYASLLSNMEKFVATSLSTDTLPAATPPPVTRRPTVPAQPAPVALDRTPSSSSSAPPARRTPSTPQPSLLDLLDAPAPSHPPAAPANAPQPPAVDLLSDLFGSAPAPSQAPLPPMAAQPAPLGGAADASGWDPFATPFGDTPNLAAPAPPAQSLAAAAFGNGLAEQDLFAGGGGDGGGGGGWVQFGGEDAFSPKADAAPAYSDPFAELLGETQAQGAPDPSAGAGAPLQGFGGLSVQGTQEGNAGRMFGGAQEAGLGGGFAAAGGGHGVSVGAAGVAQAALPPSDPLDLFSTPAAPAVRPSGPAMAMGGGGAVAGGGQARGETKGGGGAAQKGGQPPPPKLPPGWEAEWSAADGEYYYYHDNGTVTWDLPTR